MNIKFILKILLILAITASAVTAQIFLVKDFHHGIAFILFIGSLLSTTLFLLITKYPISDRFKQLHQNTIPKSEKWYQYVIAGSGVVITVYALYLQSLKAISFQYKLQIGLWAAGLFLVLAAGLLNMEFSFPRMKNIIVVLGLLLVFGCIRGYDLENVPASFHLDEGKPGLTSRNLAEGNVNWFFCSSYCHFAHISFLPSVITQSIWGHTIFGLRMASVLLGTLGLLGIYLLSDLLFGRSTALLSVIIAGFAYTHLHFSRMALPFIYPVLFSPFIAYFLFKSFIRNRFFNASVSGIIAGLGTHSYQPLQVQPLIVITFLMAVIVLSSSRKSASIILIIFLIACFVAMSPVLGLMTETSGYFARHKGVNVLSQEKCDPRTVKIAARSEVLENQIKRNFGAFHYYGDKSQKFGIKRPLIDSISGIIFIIGLGIILARCTRFSFLYFLIWMMAVIIGGGVMTKNSPFFPRINSILPPIYIIAGFSVMVGYKLLDNLSPLRKYPVHRLLVLLLIAGIAFLNFDAYFREYPEYHDIDVPTAIGKYIKQNGTDYSYYFLTVPFLNSGHKSITFIGGTEIDKRDISDPAKFFCTDQVSKRFIFIVSKKYLALIPFFQLLFPGSEVIDHKVQELHFLTLRVDEFDRASLENRLNRTVFGKNKNDLKTTGPDNVAGIFYNHGNYFGREYRDPAEITWTGYISFPRPGLYTFFCSNEELKGNYEVKINESILPDLKYVVKENLPEWNRFEVTYVSPRKPESFWLGWIAPDRKDTVIPAKFFATSPQ